MIIQKKGRPMAAFLYDGAMLPSYLITPRMPPMTPKALTRYHTSM
jgi:hypothetical protein